MELFLFPILLLGLLFAGFGGVWDNGGDDDEVNGTPGNDTLSGEDNETVHAGAGNDQVTLEDDATGHGNEGNDALAARGDSNAYGGAGNDAISVFDSAFGHGWEGDDVIFAEDTSQANGGAGNDQVQGFDSATVYGGLGNDVMFAGDRAVAYGGGGNDLFNTEGSGTVHGDDGNDYINADTGTTAYGGAGRDILIAHNHGGNAVLPAAGATLTGGAGSDLFVTSHIVYEENGDVSDEAWRPNAMTITDFNPAADVLGFAIDPAFTAGLRLHTAINAATNTTTVQLFSNGHDTSTIATVTLTGQHEIDLADIRVFSDLNLTPIDFGRSSTAGNDVLTSPGHPSGATSIYGLDGDDSITLWNGTAYGNDGDDTLTGNSTLYGGPGEDVLRSFQDIYGGAGADQITLNGFVFGGATSYQGDVFGGSGHDTISSDEMRHEPGTNGRGVVIDAGSGNDLINLAPAMNVDAGLGDDTLILDLGNALDQGFADPNRFEYFLGTDANSALRSEFTTTTLGAGTDRLILGGLDFGGGNVVMDFNATEDRIGLVLPAGDRADYAIRLITNAQSGFLELQINNVEDPSEVKSILLNGVTSGVSLSQIQLFASDAAAIAGTPYGTL